jgi:16S rRNA (uracil1498-N3)-methyltransferase
MSPDFFTTVVFMARRRFFVEAIERGHAQITGQDAHHLTRVLRVEPGQKFEISDNLQVYLAEVETARKDLVRFRILEKIDAAAPVIHTALFASLIKFERFEWLIEKATELGVSAITPVRAERSEKGLEAAALKRLARWKRIAREASEQSRRARLPDIEAPVDLADVLRSCNGYALGEAELRPILSALPEARQAGDRVALLVGPEGGWTERERAAIAAAGWTVVSLGGEILRAETAAIAALAIVNAAWGILVSHD